MPPSFVYACSISRMQPFSRSVSSVSHWASCEPMTFENRRPGAEWYIRDASGSISSLSMLYLSMSSPSVLPLTRLHERSSRPPLASSPIMPSIPPARFSSWIEYFCQLGASLQRNGTLRESRSISGMVKSTSASWATARRWSTVFVEAPMAMSRVMALRNAWRVAIERGRTESSPSS